MSLDKLMRSAFKSKTITIDGTSYIVKEMSAQDKSEYENSIYEYKQVGKEIKITPKLENAKVSLVIYTLHDEQGNKLFKGIEDIPLVKQLPSSIVEMVCDAAGELNGLDHSEVKKN